MTQEPCRCNCGYTCGRQCGLDFFGPEGCIALHYKVDCEHVWDGPEVTERFPGGGGFSSGSCSVCGMLRINHDMNAGP